MRNIADLKSDLIRKLHGTSLNKLQDVNGLIGEAGRNLITRLDPQETVRVTATENALFDDQFLYVAPADLKGDKIIDIGPIDRDNSQNYTKVMIEEFTRKKNAKDLNILYRNGIKFIRLKDDSAPSKKTVSEMGSLTGWSASSSATNPAIDSVVAITGSSYRFDVNTASGTAVLENSTLSSLDLSADAEQNRLYLWFYVKNPSKISSIGVRYGSSSGNYVSVSATASIGNTSFDAGWNLIEFDFNGATETGTVDWSAMTYLRITVNHDATGTTGLRIDSITVGSGATYNIYYYSDRLFQGTDGTLKAVPTIDTDDILLENDAYNILLYECAYLAAQELQGENGSWDETYFDKKLHGDGRRLGLYQSYGMSYPSQTKKVRSRYYEFKTGNYRG